MTDRQSFERMMYLMGMIAGPPAFLEQGELIFYVSFNDFKNDGTENFTTENFTTTSDYEMSAGAVFTEEGDIWKAYFDSGPTKEKNPTQKLLFDMKWQYIMNYKSK